MVKNIKSREQKRMGGGIDRMQKKTKKLVYAPCGSIGRRGKVTSERKNREKQAQGLLLFLCCCCLMPLCCLVVEGKVF
jgi:hypothetical protein